MTAKTAAIVIGIIFIAVGLLGFIDNPIVGDSGKAIFQAGKTHNIVHITTGVLFLLIALAAPGSINGFLKLFGILYLAIGIYGVTQMGSDDMKSLFGFLMVNKNDNYLHVALGIVIFIAGFLRRPVRA